MIFDRMVALRDCLCQQIKDDGLCDVSFCGIVPGEAAAGDYFNCGGNANGMAWVRLTTAYMATEVGVTDLTVGNCAKTLGFEVELGIMRCAAVASVNGVPPSPRVVSEATAQQIADMETMFRTVRCCNAISNKDHVIGSYQPLGPEGGVLGGILTVSLV